MSRIDELASPIEGLDLVRARAAEDRFLAVLVTIDAHGEPQVSVVNAGVLPHPVTGHEVVGFVARGRTAKLRNVRRTRRATLVFRSGWEWVAVAGPAALAGPDDPLDGIDGTALPRLLRDIFHAAGGRHDDLAAYDDVMVSERRCAVLIEPQRIWTNPIGTEHKEPSS